MRKLSFYPKLAAGNLKRAHKTFVPYLLTCIGTVMMYYMLHSISVSPGIQNMPGAGDVRSILGLGTFVIALFAVIFLFYTNSFLIKRRKKEFGLYQVLGMEKRHLALMLLYETGLTAAAALVCGLAAGTLFSRLLFLLLARLIGANVPLAFEIPAVSVADTVGLFLVIFAVIYLGDLWQLRRAAPIELIRGGQAGEREPKTKRIIALIGLLFVGAGYAFALTVESPLAALSLFFLAVVLVIVGTYLLFTAGSIAVLKGLRRNRRFYYQARHFTSVSGMLYRMKRNAVGLANICILSTMVLVLLSTTASLYFGQQDMLRSRFHQNTALTLFDAKPGDEERIAGLTAEAVARQGAKQTGVTTYRYVEAFATPGVQGYDLSGDLADRDPYHSIYLCIVPYPSWQGANVPQVRLAEGEALLYSSDGVYEEDEITVSGKTFRIVGQADELHVNSSFISGLNHMYLVVKDDEALNLALGENASALQFTYDVDGDEAMQAACAEAARAALKEAGFTRYRLQTRAETVADNQLFAGGFFFIGLFLGALFLMATVLIIYYKQITEGYEDRERFLILQNVGMGLSEVRGTIRTQVLMVFFLPLAVAVVHVAAAFPLLAKLLSLFGLINRQVFVLANLATILAFAVVYVAVFALTAREYYQIVRKA